MQAEIILETAGQRLPGIDYGDLEANLQSEVDKFAKLVSGEAKREAQGRPDGAQGDDVLIQWLIEFAQQPAMVRVYAKSLIFGISELVRVARQRANRGAEPAVVEGQQVGGPAARVKLLGKEIALPATTAAITAFIDEVTGE